MSEIWTRWQGHVINDAYPLGRYLGCSDHSGVFLTRSAARSRSDIAIKLVPANRALAESQLPSWKRAGGLTHPHLLRLIEWGGCQLDGSPYLYLLMEYADQTLAQLLPHRALSEDEAREMLIPVLDALAFLHERNLVQGQLKPANVLVVGERLKLASDPIRRLGERRANAQAPTVYDPPESLPGTGSAAGDIWALGISLCEALTRRPPSITGERGVGLTLPADLSPQFRDVVARCLSLRPQDRPGVSELVAWARGQSWSAVSAAPAAPAVLAGPAAAAMPAAPVAPAAPAAPAMPTVPAVDLHPARLVPAATASSKRRAPVAVVLGLALIVALGWAGSHLFRRQASSLAQPIAAHPHGAFAPAISGAATSAPANGRVPVPGGSAKRPHGGDGTASPNPLREVVPDVPLSARRTIHGHIKVWVRVIIEQDGSVLAALLDLPGPSRYFQRLALQAAKKWSFPPAPSSSRRLLQIRFEFSRDGTRGRAVPVR
ncbi:MAG: serine/threonine protein kinase [Steroidobacteraceae bacterium]